MKNLLLLIMAAFAIGVLADSETAPVTKQSSSHVVLIAVEN